MNFSGTPIPGVYVISPTMKCDERGYFARIFSKEEYPNFAFDIAQINITNSFTKGCIRGMHYQIAPREEIKIVSCIHGSIYDVVVDMRPESPTYRKWIANTLNDVSKNMVYVPKGCAHGIQALTHSAIAQYFSSEVYSQFHERGVRWNDPAIGIKWNLEMTMVSAKDNTYPLLEKA